MILPVIDTETKITLLRGGALFGPILGAFVIGCLKGASKRQLLSIAPAFLWCFFSLLILNPLAVQWGFWSFSFEGGGFAGAPVDILLGWAVLWGLIPCFFPSRLAVSLWLWPLIFLLFDIAFMPWLFPLLYLNKHWLLFDILCLLIAFIPSRLLFHFTFQRERLFARVALQFILFVAVFIFLLPTAVFVSLEPELSLAYWIQKLWGRLAQGGLFSAVFCMASVLGFSAVWEFALRGRGTPTPFDPPQKLVATGPYGFVRNPMQISLFLIYMACFFIEPFSLSEIRAHWLSFDEMPALLGFRLMALIVMASIVFYAGFTSWSENRHLSLRFGKDWETYKKQVFYFIPRRRAFRAQSAEIYIDYNNCQACAKFNRVIQFLNPRQILVRPAEDYRFGPINRVTYRDKDGFQAVGAKAFSRALEHVNILWAFLGFALRIPLLSHILQILLDAVFPPHYVKTKGAPKQKR